MVNLATFNDGESLESIRTKLNTNFVPKIKNKFQEIDTTIDNKQDTLISGTNIRTINGNTLLGSTNLTTPNTTYSEISVAEIDAGTASTLRTITGRRAGYILSKTDRAFTSASNTINWANSNNQFRVISSNQTISHTNMPEGQTCFLRLTNGGNHTITWNNSIRWAGGEAPSLTQNGIDIIAFKKEGSIIYGDYNLDFKV